MQQLSNELHIHIFKYLTKPTIKNCLTVCRNWYMLLGPMYYQEVYVFENAMSSFLSFVQDEQVLPLWIKKLIVTKSYTKPTYVSTKEYRHLLSCLPNLERIHIHQSVTSIWYLEHLLPIDVAVLSNIKEIKLLNNTRLHYNDNNRYLDERMAYWYTLNTIKLCRTITHLDINNFSVSYFPSESRQQRFIEYLGHFTHLTHLAIENLSPAGIPRLNLITLLNQCPKLQTFDLFSEYAQEDHALGTVAMNHHLKHFKLKVPSLPLSYLAYLVQYIPTYTQSFSLFTTHSFLLDMDPFHELLCNVKDLTFQMKGEESWHDDSTPSCIRRLWRTVDAIASTRKRISLDVDIALDHFTVFPETCVQLVHDTSMRLTLSHTDPFTYTGRTDTDLIQFLGLDKEQRALNSFVFKERGAACLNSFQLVELLTHVLSRAVKHVHITSEPFAEGRVGHHAFMPSQSMSILLSPRWEKTTKGFLHNDRIQYGVLENTYVTNTLLTDVLDPLQLKHVQLRNCRYEKTREGHMHLALKSSHLQQWVLLMNGADMPSAFNVRIKCQDRDSLYCVENKTLRPCKTLGKDAMVVTLECASLKHFQFQVRGTYSELLVSFEINMEQ